MAFLAEGVQTDLVALSLIEAGANPQSAHSCITRERLCSSSAIPRGRGWKLAASGEVRVDTGFTEYYQKWLRHWRLDNSIIQRGVTSDNW